MPKQKSFRIIRIIFSVWLKNNKKNKKMILKTNKPVKP